MEDEPEEPTEEPTDEQVNESVGDLEEQPAPRSDKGKTHASKEERKSRIEETAHMRIVGMAKGAVKQSLCAKYGIKFRECERLWGEAAKLIAEWNGSNKEDWRQENLQRYLAIYRDFKDSNPQAATKALERIDRLLGLDAPQKVEQSGELKHDHGTIGITVLRQELMNDADYITYLREKALRADSHPGAICENGEPRPMETQTPPPEA